MSTQINLSGVYAGLASIEMALGQTRLEVARVGGQVASTDARLTQLAIQFEEWVELDRRQKELQLAETRIVKVRQELETEFGHYAAVRRLMTGILQAVDAGLVTHESIQATSESDMLRTPRYWLAPAVVAIAAWLRDDPTLSGRGQDEAMRRDPGKTSLLMALVLRRYGRTEAATPWLNLYLSRQDPEDLPREAATLVDAAVCGAFGPGGRQALADFTAKWYRRIDERPEEVEQQVTRWRQALWALAPEPQTGNFQQLPSLSPTWQAIAASLKAGGLHVAVSEHFTALLGQPVTVPTTLAERIDSILDNLVTEFDPEELPLRRQESRLSAIIEFDGDTKAADARIQELDTALDERVNLPQLFANIVLYPNLSGVDLATQKYAIAVSRQFIIAAYDRLVADGRRSVPQEVELSIDGWSATVREGTEAAPLVESLTEHMNRLKRERVAAAKAILRKSFGGLVAVGLIGGALSGSIGFALVMFATAGIAYFANRKRVTEAARAGESLKQARIEHLKIALAEITDFGAEWSRLDAKAEATRQIFESLTPSMFEVSMEPRTILNTSATSVPDRRFG